MKLKVLLIGCCVVWGALSFSERSFADNLEREIVELKQKISVLEEKLSQKEKEDSARKELYEELNEIKEIFKGISVGGGATFVIQGTHNANGNDLSKDGEDTTDAAFSLDLEIEKNFSEKDRIYLHFEAGNGEGVTDELQVFSNVNADVTEDENFDLIEVWYEHNFMSIPLTLTFGKIDSTAYIDNNEYANDETTQFLGDIFKNSPTIEFPDNGPGIRFNLEPFKSLGIEFLMMDADSDWKAIFDNMFLGCEFNFKLNIFERPGNYRIYGWLNDVHHIKWNNPSKTKERNYGFGLSFDQELTEALGIFLRYGWQNPKVYADGSDFSLEQSWSTGVQLAGSLWGRNEDIFAIAFGQIFPSGDYKEANNFKAKSEKHLEVYYNFKVNNYLALTPDLQVIWDPYGGDAANGDKTIFIGGLRIQVNF
ncbi:MAG: hypothetical protein DRP69_03945 [Candidatus Duberdicusella sinuisediminis]|nr:MAG: hypothetical protein DRP69_03945 [Candidatus Omnitrophota bacterium]